MKAIINRKTYDTDDAAKLGCKCVGDFGSAGGYKEELFVTKTGNHFIYGEGGPESPYAEPTINRLLKKEAEAWKKENGI